MPKILISGANSFIGRNISRFSRFSPVSEISLMDVKPEEISFSGYDTVIHLAAITHHKGNIDRSDYYKINSDLPVRVAQNAREKGIKQFIFLSTVKVYGEYKNRTTPWNEYSECQPSDNYGKSKFAAEKELRKLDCEDFRVSIIRTPIVYGDGVKANIMSLIRLVNVMPILPFGNVSNSRNYTYTENLVGFIDRIIEKRISGTYIAMDPEPVSTTQLVFYIAISLQKKLKLITLPNLLINLGKRMFPQYFERLYGSMVLDNTLTIKELEYEPPFTTEEGISKMMIKYVEQKGRKNLILER